MGSSASVPSSSFSELLTKQNAETTSAIIEAFKEDEKFIALSKFEAEGIVKRDEEDAQKLQSGILISVEAGVLETIEPPEYVTIDVVGKSPDEVCNIIVEHVGEAAQNGCVIVLCGLSGTGKGTTVTNLKEKLPNTVTWSNGNVFRALTLLAVKWCDANSSENIADALTTENLESFMQMLSFDKFEGEWDIKIDGLGVTEFVSKIQNTLLKGPEVSRNIPTVAQQTQGQVIKFAADATRRMGEDGLNVLLEGREATVNYVPTPFRYTLTMSDTTLLGQRRAAQRIAAEAQKQLKDVGDLTDEAVREKTSEVMVAMADAASAPEPLAEVSTEEPTATSAEESAAGSQEVEQVAEGTQEP